MPDSLTFAGYELNSLIGAGPVHLRTGTSLGAPEPITALIERLVTDGELVTGVRSGNREITLPLTIMTGDRKTALAIEAAIVTQVNKAYSALVWTPENGTPTVFDCYRGKVERVWDPNNARHGSLSIDVTLPALPYSRSFSPIQLGPTALSSLSLDQFDDLTGLSTTAPTGSYRNTATSVTTTVDTTSFVESPASVRTAATMSGDGNNIYFTGGAQVSQYAGYPYRWARTLVGGVTDLSQYNSVAIQSRYAAYNSDGTTYTGSLYPGAWMTWTLKLTSASGTATWTATTTVDKTFTGVYFPIGTTPSSTTGTFSLTTVSSYELICVFNYQQNSYPGYPAPANSLNPNRVDLYVDDMRAYPAGGTVAATPSALLRFDGISGTARTPVDLRVDCATGFTAQRLILGRSPNPAANFDPLLKIVDAATTSTAVADSNLLNGTGNARSVGTSNAVVYRRAARTFNGTYAVLARIRNVTVGTTVTVSAAIAGDTTYSNVISRTFSSTEITSLNIGGTTWAIVPLGTFALPPRGVDAANSTSDVTITFSASAGGYYLDEAYLLDLDGENLIVDLPSGTTKAKFHVLSPNGEELTARVLAGAQTDRSDAISVSPWLKGQAVFNFDPGSNTVLLVLDRSTGGGSVTVSYYPRFLGEVTL